MPVEEVGDDRAVGSHSRVTDFGLCDEITFESTMHLLSVDGTVQLGTPSVIRTIQGRCH